uniref:Integrase, catalytic region, zinc finger, CCHC-type, peptidase aspartic, catalytic n=1 Tax=Tanacetum cinerariifolium TaxID=118510 RepID=A0A699K8L2_TANCI|nr:hypothetical protein [Tanacetum cinerariifolium]
MIERVIHTVKTDMVIHTEKTEMMRLVVEIEYVGKIADVFDKATWSFDCLQPEQVDLANLSHYGFDNLAEYMNESRYATVQNSDFPAQQDALILTVIKQLKTQVVNCTKINQENKSVNEILTAELERYKDQVRILKEGNNVKELNNIVFKRNQSAQTVHMLTKPQFFYDRSTRKAFSFQNPCYLKKAQQLEPKVYDSSVIQKTNAIVIRDSEETLMLEDESLEVPKELLKVSMVNSSLKKLEFHLASFDVVVKERTTATAITEAVEQHSYENERLLEQAISTYIVNIVVNANVNYAYEPVNECERCVILETELQKNFIKKECYDKLFKQYTTLEKHCLSLEVDTQLEQEIFQRNNSF